MLDVSHDTITRRFASEFQSGVTKRDAKIRAQLLQRALSGKSDPQSANCLLFCARSMLGLSDRPESRRLLDADPLTLILRRQAHGFLPPATEQFEIPASLEISSDKEILGRDEPNGVGHIQSGDEHSDSPLF